ncbi:hypothetical protein RHGRI_014793 [Rhododendron griersonianum]|uniref:Uncharacterized protein n=1 Tax=Rhododendron griersonianum TaxID=479676 RepID=A0AAV6KAS5_9ERIC|nr:hypothetical protein RHGRI_014793 [Rhododendron griersonianum]
MTTRRGHNKEVTGLSGSKCQRALSPVCWATRPFTIPLTFAIAEFKGIENSLQNKPPVSIVAPLLAQEPPPAGGVPHVPPPPTPQARGWRFTQVEYHRLQCDLVDVHAHQDFFWQSLTDYRLEQHCNAYDVWGLLHQLARLPHLMRPRSTPSFRLRLVAMVPPSDSVGMRAYKIAQPTFLNTGDLGRRFRVTFKLSDCKGEEDGIRSRRPTNGARSTLAFRAGQTGDLFIAATTSGHGEHTN